MKLTLLIAWLYHHRQHLLRKGSWQLIRYFYHKLDMLRLLFALGIRKRPTYLYLPFLEGSLIWSLVVVVVDHHQLLQACRRLLQRLPFQPLDCDPRQVRTKVEGFIE
jgi:hypothetical protein